MTDWKPIETAPNETTLALVAEPPEWPCVDWCMVVAVGSGDCWVHMGRHLKPTHWMPLDPPK